LREKPLAGAIALSTKLTCPDCGGVLGVAEPGESSCSCFKAESISLADASSASEAGGQPTLNDTQAVETLSKVCFKCGANVVGKKRYKDSRGYMCADCNKAEIAAEKEGTARCAECGRRVKEAGLVEFRGVRMCKLCISELRDAEKKKIKPISSQNFDAQEKKNIWRMVILLIILGFFIVLSLIQHH
jgi:DNA-directed RNA polymerase subunit RPC12/RpoP